MTNPEENIYLEVVKDDQGRLRLADRKTGKYVAFQADTIADVQVEENPTDLQAATFTIYTDDRMITKDIKEYLESK